MPELTDPKSLFTTVNGEVKFTPGSALAALGAGETAAFHVYYTMADDGGAQASARLDFSVTGQNDAPVAKPDTGATTENGDLTFDVLGNDEDPDHAMCLRTCDWSVRR